MAITTLDGVIAGLQAPVYFAKTNGTASVAGHPRTSFYTNGYPPAATAPSSGLSGAALTSKTGQLPFTNPVSGNTYLSRLQASISSSSSSSAQGVFNLLVDRLWDNSGLDRTLATAQTVNSAAWPARDNNGSTNGEGVYIAIEISTAMGTGVPSISMSYTNSAGTAGRTGTNITAVVASSMQGVWVLMGLQAGDTGVRSIQTVTFSVTWGTAGVLHLVAYRPIAMLTGNHVLSSSITMNPKTPSEDAVTLGFPRLYDNSVLQIISHNTASMTSTGLAGNIQYAQG